MAAAGGKQSWEPTQATADEFTVTPDANGDYASMYKMCFQTTDPS